MNDNKSDVEKFAEGTLSLIQEALELSDGCHKHAMFYLLNSAMIMLRAEHISEADIHEIVSLNMENASKGAAVLQRLGDTLQ